MLDKGYPQALYSLDRLPLDAVLPDEPRFALLVDGGRLVVRPALRRRAAGISTGACDDLVATVLARRQLDASGFARCGFGAAWAEAVGHWRGRMIDRHKARHRVEAAVRLDAAQVQRLMQAGQRSWGRLALAARLAGLGGVITAGRAPAGRLALRAALAQAAARGAEPRHAALLARHGFEAAERSALLRLVDQLGEEARGPLEQQRQEASDELCVIRAALIGDAALFCQAAAALLRPAQRQALRMGRLLGSRRELRSAVWAKAEDAVPPSHPIAISSGLISLRPSSARSPATRQRRIVRPEVPGGVLPTHGDGYGDPGSRIGA